MSIHSRRFLLAAALLSPAPGFAHPISPDTLGATPTPTTGERSLSAPVRDRVELDVLADGTIWVRGRTYKARFDREGASYVPFLGSEAPRNFPLDLQLARVSVGGADIAFDADASPVLDPGGASISFQRRTFTERYLLTADGIEQTFVFDFLPSRGEIVVTIGVESLFAQRADAEGFRFENEHGHVRYGRAFALDACGTKDAIESRFEGDHIEIRVPADRVAEAILPLTVDPVLSTFSVRDTAIDEFAADTAYDTTLGAFLTVFEEVFSAQDHDVRAVRHSPAGDALVWQSIDITASNWRVPAVANNNAVGQFLVVAAVGAPPGREIQGRTVAANSMAASAVFPISIAAEPGDKYAPDVGGDPSAFLPSHYYVVWETEFALGDRDVHGRLVNTGGGLVGLGTQPVSTGVLELDGNPSISNSNGDVPAGAKYWNVVFEREISPTNHDIWGRRITVLGALMPGPSALASSPLDERNPTCTAGLETEFDASPWLLAYQISTAANGWDVFTRVFDGAVLLNYFQLSVQFATNGLHQTEPVCDTDGKGFVVAYLEQALLGVGSTDVRATSMSWLNGSVGFSESNLSVTPGLEIDLRPALCAAHAGGADSGQTLIVFDRNDGASRDVFATSYVMPAGGPITPYCFGDGSGIACPCLNFGGTGRGCANSANATGARLFASGDASIQADNFVLTAEGMPEATMVLFFQGSVQTNSGNGTVFGDGLRCATGVVVRLGTKAAVSGTASHPDFADPSIAASGAVVPGTTRYYQAHYRNSATFCAAGTFNLTNGLRVLWLP